MSTRPSQHFFFPTLFQTRAGPWGGSCSHCQPRPWQQEPLELGQEAGTGQEALDVQDHSWMGQEGGTAALLHPPA